MRSAQRYLMDTPLDPVFRVPPVHALGDHVQTARLRAAGIDPDSRLTADGSGLTQGRRQQLMQRLRPEPGTVVHSDRRVEVRDDALEHTIYDKHVELRG